MEHVAAGEIARSALVGTRFGDVRWVPETGSTNADALELARQGATIVDVGGESTRPGAEPVDADTEAARVVPASIIIFCLKRLFSEYADMK